MISLGFDLETGHADDIFRYQAYDETGYIRLAGVIGASGVPVTSATGLDRNLRQVLEAADEVYGHNILGFDGLALVQHLGMDWEKFAAKARDTLLVARQVYPPRSMGAGRPSPDKYDLGTVAARLGVEGKTDNVSKLARKHGGYDRIPLGDRDFIAYLEGDLRATKAIADRLQMDGYLVREHRIASLAGRMTLNGFLVDQDLLKQRLAEGEEQKARAIAVLGGAFGLPTTETLVRGRKGHKYEVIIDRKSPLSGNAGREWLASIYQRFGVKNPPMTDKGKLSVQTDDLAKVAGDTRCPNDLKVVIELMNIITKTRTVYQTAEKWLCPDGRVHPSNRFSQSSGRWSVLNPGMTVFGKRGGRHHEREIFTADPGHVLVSCDLSQVDMRSMAGHSQDPAYMAMFGPGRDAHEEIAAQVFGTKDRRQDAKAIGHGWNYGLGENSMIHVHGLDPKLVYAFTAGMKRRFPRLVEWREEIRQAGSAGEVLDNGFGRRMRCMPPRAYTVAPALMGQGGARDIMGEALLRLPDEFRPYLRAFVHDEEVFDIPVKEAREIMHEIKKAMTFEWRGVPITCDMSSPGPNWGAISGKGWDDSWFEAGLARF